MGEQQLFRCCLRMKRVKIKCPSKSILAVCFLTSVVCFIILLYKNECSAFDLSEYKNVSYFLRRKDSSSVVQSILSETDYGNLIDINFTFPISNFVCDKAMPLLLILVHSAPANYAKRKTIRETWGKSTDDIKILFLLGISNDTQTAHRIENENILYQDLLQGSFIDSYRNMTYKHAMGLKFVVYYCFHTKYVLKIDDDTVVNMPLLKIFLNTDLSPYGAEKLLMCNVVKNARVYRHYRSKWRITFDEYGDKYYPTYCLGWYILYSPDIILQFYKQVQTRKYFWIDDVLITGMVAAEVNFVNHVDISALTLSQFAVTPMSKIPLRKCRLFLFGWADMHEDEIRSVWQYIEKNDYVPQSAMVTVE